MHSGDELLCCCPRPTLQLPFPMLRHILGLRVNKSFRVCTKDRYERAISWNFVQLQVLMDGLTMPLHKFSLLGQQQDNLSTGRWVSQFRIYLDDVLILIGLTASSSTLSTFNIVADSVAALESQWIIRDECRMLLCVIYCNSVYSWRKHCRDLHV